MALKELNLLITEDEALNNTVSYKEALKLESFKGQGIYFLFENKKLMYIGYSQNCKRRIQTHKYRPNGSTTFDSVYCIKTSFQDLSDLKELERQYIYELDPKYNKSSKMPSKNYAFMGGEIRDCDELKND